MEHRQWGCAVGQWILVLLCAPSAGAELAPQTDPTSAGETAASELHQGLDLSGHSGSVDWQELAAAGHSFVFLKATEGMDFRDTAFDDHWTAAKEAGLVRGAYHFYVTEDDPEKQAAFFISVVSLDSGDFAPVVDIEVLSHNTQSDLAKRLQRFLDLLEAHYQIKPIIYTAPNFWNEHLDDSFGGYPLWVAEYGVEKPRLPSGWETWHLWQWKGDATVPGVEKSADLSHVHREGPDLSRLLLPY